MPKQPNLRDRICVERRRELVGESDAWADSGETWDGDGDDWEGEGSPTPGVSEGDWVGIGPAGALRAEIVQVEFGSQEVVHAGKLKGVARCTVTVRASDFTRQLTTDDRFRVYGRGAALTDQALNIRHAPPPGRGQYITFTCDAGLAT